MIELKVVDSTGTPAQILPDWSDLTISQDRFDVSIMSFTYSNVGRHFNLLKPGTIISYSVSGFSPSSNWFEVGDNQVNKLDASNAVSFSLKSTVGNFDRMILGPGVGSTVVEDNLFKYENRTIGYMIRRAIDNSLSRGSQSKWLDTSSWTFSDTVDSKGTPWYSTYDHTFSPGTKVADVIDWGVQLGFVEVEMKDRKLYAYEPASRGNNYTVAPNIKAIRSNVLSEHTEQYSVSEWYNSILVTGDTISPNPGPSCVWVQDAASIATDGYREGLWNVSGANQQSTLLEAGKRYLELHKKPMTSRTFATVFHPELNPKPLVDFQVADLIYIGSDASALSGNVRLISTTWNSSSSASVNITLDTLLDNRARILDQRLARLGITR